MAGAAQALGALTSQATTHLQPQVLTVPSAAHLLLQPAPSPPKRPESGGSSSGSTTLSATSSPPLAGTGSGDELSTAAAGGGAGQPGSGSAGPSPRKKPRKQAHVNREDDQNNWADDGDEVRHCTELFCTIHPLSHNSLGFVMRLLKSSCSKIFLAWAVAQL